MATHTHKCIYLYIYIWVIYMCYIYVQINNISHTCFKLNYLLTHSVVQSPSSETNWFAASQEIPRISRNPNVHYRTHKRPPPVSILGHPNPVHIPTSHLLEIYPNIIHPSTPRSPQWSPSLRFLHQDPIQPLSSPIRTTCPAHFNLLDFITRTIYTCFIQGESLARGPKLFSIKNYVIVIMTWKFIYTYRERCKTGPAHNRCWNWSPFTSKHT